ncbi:MAG: transposase [Desulfomonilaceae bacterium]
MPRQKVQLCIVRLVRHSLKFVSRKQRKDIYVASAEDQALANLELFGKKWDATHPKLSQSWRSNWQRVIPYLGYPDPVRKAIYTTNAIESLNITFRKATKN